MLTETYDIAPWDLSGVSEAQKGREHRGLTAAADLRTPCPGMGQVVAKHASQPGMQVNLGCFCQATTHSAGSFAPAVK